MADWRGLVAQGMQADVQQRGRNPAVENFGNLVKFAMAEGSKKQGEVRAEEAAGRTAARKSLYARYPGMAAEAAGEELPEGAGTMTVPEDMRLGKVTYDESGKAKYTYETTDLAESDLGKMYNNFVTDIKKENARNAILPNYKSITIPTYDEWKTEMFGPATGEGPMSETDILEFFGKTEEDIEYTLSQAPGMTRDQLMDMLRQYMQQTR